MAEGSDDGAVCKEIAIEVSRFDVKDIDEDTDVGEDMLALLGEVIFHESILSARSQLWSRDSDNTGYSSKG